MLPETIPEAWLEELNRLLSEKQVPHSARPFEAITELSRVWNCEVNFNSPQVKSIFSWFESHSPKGSHAVGSLFTGTYYFDAYFWRVSIPLAYGIVPLNPLDSIEGASDSVKTQIQTNKERFTDYLFLWVDTMDYGFGIDDVPHMAKLSIFAHALMRSADRELRATVRLLTEDRQPNSKAMDTSRMTTEMFLKAYLAAHRGMTEQEAKERFGHSIEKLAENCKTIGSQEELERVQEVSRIFPKIESRYDGKTYNRETLWLGYCVAQCVATLYVRSLTDRDSRSQMFGNMSCRAEKRP